MPGKWRIFARRKKYHERHENYRQVLFLVAFGSRKFLYRIRHQGKKLVSVWTGLHMLQWVTLSCSIWLPGRDLRVRLPGPIRKLSCILCITTEDDFYSIKIGKPARTAEFADFEFGMPSVGFEPTANRLWVCCSNRWATRAWTDSLVKRIF